MKLVWVLLISFCAHAATGIVESYTYIGVFLFAANVPGLHIPVRTTQVVIMKLPVFEG
jgi:hypothetical protein